MRQIEAILRVFVPGAGPRAGRARNLGAARVINGGSADAAKARALLETEGYFAASVQARRARDGEPKDGFVLLRLRDLDFGVQFEVIDNGLGFPEKDRHRLIEPYVTTRAKGHGLGLAIVDRIVRAHGGRITVRSTAGAGTTILLLLPAVQPEGLGRERPSLEVAPGL